MKKIYSKSLQELYQETGGKEKGLSNEEVIRQQEKFGKNSLHSEEKESPFQIFISQFKDVIVLILILASIISFFSGNVESTIVILVVLIINAILGTIQHIKAQKSVESLKKLSSPKIKVLRDGEKIELPSEELVPGDIMYIEAGDMIPADGRIIECFSLLVNESSLTGESESVEKTSEILSDDDLPLGEQKNMVFSGGLVSNGRGVVLVTATGMNSEIGKIAGLLEATKEKSTPLQIALDNFGKKLATGIIILCIIIFGVIYFHGNTVMESLLFAVALAVAAIPEALSPIVTIVLALGTQKLAKENAIIKNLKSVEVLGCVSIICSDKTGTLTQNKMTVTKAYLNNEIIEEEHIDKSSSTGMLFLQEGVLCSDATLEVGDPTEIALINLATKHSLDFKELKEKFSRLAEIPFDSDRKLMSTLHNIDGKFIMFTKGAVDTLLARTTHINDNGKIREITTNDIINIEKANMTFAENGLRVLTYSYKILDNEKNITLEDEKDYIFLGLVGMIDPPRVESKEAVQKCITAGIKPVMITGDHKVTAKTIAKEIGIYKDGDNVLEGIELERMSDEELEKIVANTSVYARVSPEHKIRIVQAWQKLGKICAMTGDGVNDAPALKRADIGIAMGVTGTEVSKDAASMILTDDNFSTIVKAITTGRNIFTNIKNSIRFLLSGNTGAIIAVIYASIANFPIIFAPVHLLFINLLTDSLPAIAIGMEEGNSDILKEKPRNPNEPILTRDFSIRILVEGLFIAIAVIGGFLYGYRDGDSLKASTMAFAILCLARLFHGFNCRGNGNIFQLGIFKNIYSWLAFFIGVLLINIVLFVPALHSIFEVTPLNSNEILRVYLYAFIPTIIIQICETITNSRR